MGRGEVHSERNEAISVGPSRKRKGAQCVEGGGLRSGLKGQVKFVVSGLQGVGGRNLSRGPKCDLGAPWELRNKM